jgi:hypothetical protein
MQRVLRGLAREGLDLRPLRGLEVFGGRGTYHTLEVVEALADLEIWELNEARVETLRARFPAQRVLQTDSYRELTRTTSRYDIVVADSDAVSGDHYEHFDLFPMLFGVLNDRAILVLNVTTRVGPNPNPERLRRRALFYEVNDPRNVGLATMRETYRTLIEQAGWRLESIFFQRRWTWNPRGKALYYAVLRVARDPKVESETPGPRPSS